MYSKKLLDCLCHAVLPFQQMLRWLKAEILTILPIFFNYLGVLCIILFVSQGCHLTFISILLFKIGYYGHSDNYYFTVIIFCWY